MVEQSPGCAADLAEREAELVGRQACVGERLAYLWGLFDKEGIDAFERDACLGDAVSALLEHVVEDEECFFFEFGEYRIELFTRAFEIGDRAGENGAVLGDDGIEICEQVACFVHACADIFGSGLDFCRDGVHAIEPDL